MKLMRCLVAMFTLQLLLVTGCSQEQEKKVSVMSGVNRPAPTESFNMDVVTTIGNYSYIPINKDYTPPDKIVEILGVVDAFEKKHPALEVKHWVLDDRQNGYRMHSYIYGIWVTHRPKEK